MSLNLYSLDFVNYSVFWEYEIFKWSLKNSQLIWCRCYYYYLPKNVDEEKLIKSMPRKWVVKSCFYIITCICGCWSGVYTWMSMSGWIHSIMILGDSNGWISYLSLHIALFRLSLSFFKASGIYSDHVKKKELFVFQVFRIATQNVLSKPLDLQWDF